MMENRQNWFSKKLYPIDLPTMKMTATFLLFFSKFLIVSFCACNSSGTGNNSFRSQQTESPVITVPVYDLNSENSIINLTKELVEISGLCDYNPENSLICINDEEGLIYKISKDGEVTSIASFADKGDYEGICRIDNMVYVVNSKGNIYPFDLNTGKPQDKIKTKLGQSNDVEGLSVSINPDALLLACKAKPELVKSQDFKKSKAIYEYNILTEEINEMPFLLIKQEQLINWIRMDEHYTSLSKFKQNALIARLKEFSPSGIAVQPRSSEIYVLSSKGKLLCIFNASKELTRIHFLGNKHRQPEGICFDEQNKLYIANEGDGLQGRIFVYSPVSLN